MSISQENIRRLLDTLSTFNATLGCGVTRLPLSDEDMVARAYIKEEMERVHLKIEEDSVGNIFGILEGTDPTLPMVWTGSHIDTVLNGGKFDGACGVICGLEAVRAIQAEGLSHKRSIAVVVYTAEEPTGFACGCLGSRALAGCLHLEDSTVLRDNRGECLYDKLLRRGYDLTKFSEIPSRTKNCYAALELHIEQAGSLEANNCPVGLVKYICAPTNLKIVLRGKQAHAGGMSMEERQDAFMACAEMALCLEKMARETESEYTTGTVGEVYIHHGGSNIIPGEVRFTIDIRDCDGPWKEKMTQRLLEEMQAIGARRRVTVEVEVENNDLPVTCDPKLMAMLEESCREADIPWMHTISGAYHDSLFIGKVAPVAMIFVPSRGGVSHCPEEWTDLSDIEQGCRVLTDTLIKVANQE